MTTEFILLLGLFVFLVAGSFFGDRGPKSVFANSGPRLGARIEKHLSTGHAFNYPQNGWEPPPGGAPSGVQ